MSTQPNMTSVDQIVTRPIADLATARASQLPRTQHALMSAWGGPAQSRTCYVAAMNGAAVTTLISIRVPPGVLAVAVDALYTGNGSISLTTSLGAVTFYAAIDFDAVQALDYATWATADGDSDGLVGSLPVRSSVAWSFDNVEVTVVVDPEASRDLTLFALTVRPIHVTR